MLSCMSERPKTLQHMRQLMALATLTACKHDQAGSDASAPAVDATSEPKPDAMLDTPVDAATDSANDAGVVDASSKKEGGVVTMPSVDVTVTVPKPHPTYHVVDMLPPPARTK